MSHIITYTEEIEEHGFCQQRPALETGDRYLHEVDGKMRLRIVRDVRFDHYVWENVAQWTIDVEEFFKDEFSFCSLPVGQSAVSVFVVDGLIGVLSCDKDLVKGELVIPATIGVVPVRGVAPFGFFACRNLTKVVFTPMVMIAYEYAFAQSGLREMVFNDDVPVRLHPSAIDGCDCLPKFSLLFDRPFPGKYFFCS